MYYIDYSLHLIIFALLSSGILISNNIYKKNYEASLDVLLALFSFSLGLVLLFINYFYSNYYLFVISPILVIVPQFYIYFREKFNIESIVPCNNIFRLFDIFFFVSISLLLLYIPTIVTTYYRPIWFFVIIAVNVALLAYNAMHTLSKLRSYLMIFKILFLSLILRASAFFISDYPIGNDPWAHMGFISSLFNSGTLESLGQYYSNYPLCHINAVSFMHFTGYSVHVSLFFIGVVLTISALFLYLFVKKITNNNNIAMMSLLLLLFSDHFISWSISILAMSFGIAFYAILLYTATLNKGRRVQVLLVIIIICIIYTHTVTTFISILMMIVIFFVSWTLHRTNSKHDLYYGLPLISVSLLLTYLRWSSESYPFFDRILSTLYNSLTQEAEFLGRSLTNPDAIFNVGILIATTGFFLFIAFGLYGVFTSIRINKSYMPWAILIAIQFFVFFVFPIFGIRNIIPSRWPAFIYCVLTMFVSIGLFTIFLKRGREKILLSITVFLLVFVMISNNITNIDSPIYAEEYTQSSLMTKTSEYLLFEKTINTYENNIYVDFVAKHRIYGTHFEYFKAYNYPLNAQREKPNLSSIDDGLIVWRRISLSKYMRISNSLMLLGEDFYSKLNTESNCVFDFGSSKAYYQN